MTHLASLVAELRRPRLLIRAARHGLADYNRSRDLKRLMACPTAPAPERAVKVLLAKEAALEDARREGGTSYSFTRHIELLIALLAEARLLAPAPAKI